MRIIHERAVKRFLIVVLTDEEELTQDEIILDERETNGYLSGYEVEQTDAGRYEFWVNGRNKNDAMKTLKRDLKLCGLKV